MLRARGLHILLRCLSIRASLFTTSLLQGCFAVHLQSFTPLPQLTQLVESCPTTIPLSVLHPSGDSSRGYQFLLGVIPVTRVYPDSLREIVSTTLATHAGLAHCGLTTSQEHSRELPRFEVAITSASVNGYDLIVVRRPSASVSLEGTLLGPDGTAKRCQAEGSFSEFSRFAFAEQLEAALEQASTRAALMLLSCLGLIPDAVQTQ